MLRFMDWLFGSAFGAFTGILGMLFVFALGMFVGIGMSNRADTLKEKTMQLALDKCVDRLSEERLNQ